MYSLRALTYPPKMYLFSLRQCYLLVTAVPDLSTTDKLISCLLHAAFRRNNLIRWGVISAPYYVFKLCQQDPAQGLLAQSSEFSRTRHGHSVMGWKDIKRRLHEQIASIFEMGRLLSLLFIRLSLWGMVMFLVFCVSSLWTVAHAVKF